MSHNRREASRNLIGKFEIFLHAMEVFHLTSLQAPIVRDSSVAMSWVAVGDVEDKELLAGARTEGVEVEGEEPVGGELEEDWVDPALFLSQILNSHLK